MNCDNCRFYRWYYDRCEKWNCEVDAREVHNCFEQRETPVRDAMANSGQITLWHRETGVGA